MCCDWGVLKEKCVDHNRERIENLSKANAVKEKVIHLDQLEFLPIFPYTVQGRTTCLSNQCRAQFSIDPYVADLRIFFNIKKKKSSSLHYIGKRQKSSLPEKKEL